MMEAVALLVTGIISAALLVAVAASWQFVVAFLMGFGLSQEAAAFGPIPTVMFAALAFDWFLGAARTGKQSS